MSANQRLVKEFLNIAIEELIITHSDVTPANHHQLIKSWCEVYEDVPPRNRAEVCVRDALEEARYRLARHVRRLQLNA